MYLVLDGHDDGDDDDCEDDDDDCEDDNDDSCDYDGDGCELIQCQYIIICNV